MEGNVLKDCRCGHIGAQHFCDSGIGSHDGQCWADMYCPCRYFFEKEPEVPSADPE